MHFIFFLYLNQRKENNAAVEEYTDENKNLHQMLFQDLHPEEQLDVPGKLQNGCFYDNLDQCVLF